MRPRQVEDLARDVAHIDVGMPEHKAELVRLNAQLAGLGQRAERIEQQLQWCVWLLAFIAGCVAHLAFWQ